MSIAGLVTRGIRTMDDDECACSASCERVVEMLLHRLPPMTFRRMRLSFAMALRYSFDMGDEATRVEKAVEKVLADGVRTADLMGPEGGTPVSTSQMGDAVIAALDASL